MGRIIMGRENLLKVMEVFKIFIKMVVSQEIELPYDPAIPLAGMHIEEIRIERDTCTQCSLQHSLQQLGHGINPGVHWQMNG